MADVGFVPGLHHDARQRLGAGKSRTSTRHGTIRGFSVGAYFLRITGDRIQRLALADPDVNQQLRVDGETGGQFVERGA